MTCLHCKQAIPPERLEALPGTRHCVSCAPTHAPVRVIDPNLVCAKASGGGRNGFAPQD